MPSQNLDAGGGPAPGSFVAGPIRQTECDDFDSCRSLIGHGQPLGDRRVAVK